MLTVWRPGNSLMELWLNADNHFLIRRWEDGWWSWVEINLIFLFIGHRAENLRFVSVSGRFEAFNISNISQVSYSVQSLLYRQRVETRKHMSGRVG